ncbi:MAG TPA: TonB family protein [Pyrinomonadaceae bacterium]|nr:TonB family protein [Pyrinomonadaceae bacterium]
MIKLTNLTSRFIFALVTILALSFLCCETASAQCACAKRNITAIEEFKDADLVFTGEIMDIQKSELDNKQRYYETVKIAVNRAWKRNVDSVVTIKYYVNGCIQGWKVGDKYLVYGYLNPDKVTYSTRCCCSRTGGLEKTEADIAEFFNGGYSLSHVNAPQKEKVIIAGWMNSRATNFQNPLYPSAIKKPRPAARVEVRIMTDADGNVISAYVSRGPTDFHNAALDAVRKLKFPPTSLSGVPTKVSGWISFDFKP